MALKSLRTACAVFVFIVAWALIPTTTAVASDGYSIKVKFVNLKDTTVILGHHFSKSIYPDDTVHLNSKGVGVFEGKKKLPFGLYILFVPSKGNYFDIMLDDDQSFTLKVDTSDYQKYTKVSGSRVNKDFFKYQLYLTSKRDQVNKLNELKKNAIGSRVDSITNAISVIDKDVKQYVDGLIKKHKSDFMGRFLTSMKEVEVPEPPKDVKDTLFKYHYYRNHYFDNFKLSDPDLLRTPFYENKMLTYLDKVVPQMPDSLYPEVDKVIETSRTTPELFRYVLVSLFNHYAQSNLMGMDAVTIHIAEKYYIPEATWSDTTFINKLKKQIKVNKPLLIGKPAPDIRLVQVPDEHFMAAATDTTLQRNVYVGNFFNLRQTAAEYTVICFWEADCSHCKKAVPELYKVYQKLKDRGVQVIAVNLLFGEEGKIKWIDFVNKNKLYGWINAWNPYDYSFKEIYDVNSTPVIYLFDKEMKIVAKRIGPEQIEEIVNVLSKSKKN